MNRMVAFCGLVCTECPAYIATQNHDREALKQVAAQWSEQFGVSLTPDYCLCDGCLSPGGWLSGHCYECEIRACGLGRGVVNCAYCPAYGCEKLQGVFNFAPEAKARLEEVRASL